MFEFRQPIPVREAIDRIMSHVTSGEIERVALGNSYGRMLAEPIIASHDVPSFHRAPYDGFAIRSQDSVGASESNRVLFRVVDYIGAGSVATKEVAQGEAVRIMTGAAMPQHTDAVVMLEQTQEQADGEMFTIRKSFAPWENVSLQGEDAKLGERLIEAGEVIHPGTIALLATFGYSTVQVAKKPVVGLITTGSELLGVDEPLVHGKIRNSNGPMIEAQLARMQIPSQSFGNLHDDLEASLKCIQQALEVSHFVITTGGVSVGDYDHLPAIYAKLGATVLFNKVGMRPGSVTTVAVKDGKFLFGLSGNPSACYTGFELFVRPVLLKTMGASKPYLPYMQAVLTEDFTKPNPFTRFVRSIYQFENDHATITPAGFNKSNAVSSIARGNAFMVLPGGTRGYKKGDVVDVLILGAEDGASEWRI